MGSTIMPTIRYQDTDAALNWLKDALGFAERLVVRGDDGAIIHAELVLGDGMVMFGPIQDGEFDSFMTQPAKIGNLETQSPYIVVPNADAQLAQVKNAGGEIIMDIENKEYGGRGFGCRDPEGHIWNVGDFDPWA